jgi:hypothetical protein
MNYVDGYIVPVPKKNLPAYRRASKKMGKIWREYGALQVHDLRRLHDFVRRLSRPRIASTVIGSRPGDPQKRYRTDHAAR